jgi:hypothetical protein
MNCSLMCAAPRCCLRICSLALALAAGAVVVGHSGCAQDAQPGSQAPEKFIPLPDPSQRITTGGGDSNSNNGSPRKVRMRESE